MINSHAVAALFAVALAIPSVACAQGLKDAKVALVTGNWKVLRSTDPMKDTTNCTGIYRDNYSVQLTPDRIFIGIQGGIRSVTLRFDDKPAKSLRLAEDIEKNIRSLIISGSEFAELSDSLRLRYQVGTLVSGIASGDLDLTGIRQALESIRSGCPTQANSESAQSRSQAGGPLCSSVLVERMKSQGIKDDQILAMCRQ